MRDIIINEDRKKSGSLAVLGFIMDLVVGYVGFIGVIEANVIYIVIGLFGFLFFGTCFIYIIKNVVKPKPVLIISNDGINDMSTAISVGFVSWDEIKEVYISKVFTQKFIGVKLYNSNNLLRRVSYIKKIALKLNLLFGFPPVAINLSTANMEFNKVISIIKNRLELHYNNLD